jgi:hypothetical protein
MSERGGSMKIVNLQATVLLGVKFFTSVELFVVGCGSVVCRKSTHVERPPPYYILLF